MTSEGKRRGSSYSGGRGLSGEGPGSRLILPPRQVERWGVSYGRQRARWRGGSEEVSGSFQLILQ